MTSNYVDNWDRLPEPLQQALTPILARLDEGADRLFDRRLNLSFEAAVTELSVPGLVALTDGLRALGALLQSRVRVADPAAGALLFEGLPVTVYDLPLYTPCLYLSQLAQAMDEQNVRLWKESTAGELIGILLVMARLIRPDIEHARVLIAALHDMLLLSPAHLPLAEEAARQDEYPNAACLAAAAVQLVARRL